MRVVVAEFFTDKWPSCCTTNSTKALGCRVNWKY